MTQEFWDGLYAERRWSGNPNAVLVDLAADLPPGSALDLGCGEGGDAVWLAERGWSVTGVDVSEVALGRARAEAAARGLAIAFEHVDLVDGFPAGTWDLVSACFLQSPLELPRDVLLRLAAAAVRPGGHLVVVDHAEPPPGSDHPEHLFPKVEETVAALDLDEAWTVLVAEKRTRVGVRDGKELPFVDGVVLAGCQPTR